MLFSADPALGRRPTGARVGVVADQGVPLKALVSLRRLVPRLTIAPAERSRAGTADATPRRVSGVLRCERMALTAGGNRDSSGLVLLVRHHLQVRGVHARPV